MNLLFPVAAQTKFLGKVLESGREVRGGERIVEMIRGSLREEPLPEFRTSFTVGKGVLDQIFLMILNLRFPKQVDMLATEANTPLLNLKTPEEALSYLEAVIKSGTSEQEKSGTVFVMGNTGVHTSKKQITWRGLSFDAKKQISTTVYQRFQL